MKRIDLNIDDLVREHAAGKPPQQLAREFGVGLTTIHNRLDAAGGKRDGRARTDVAAADVVALFLQGVGVKGVADRLGCADSLILRILRDAGVPTRTRSEQQLLRMANASPEERQRLAQAANAAVRGRRPSLDRMLATAATYEANGTRRQSGYEFELAEMLRMRGIETVPQKAIGIYNCDLAAAPVAVEVFGGKWHWHGDHLARTEPRFRDLMNRGWHVLAVAVTDESPLTAAVGDYVAAYVQQARRNPTARREYRVIWRAGEYSTGGSLDDDHVSIEPPFTYARDVATGRYKTAPR